MANWSHEHVAIKSIGRLVLACVAVMVITTLLLVGTALQIAFTIDGAAQQDERRRASNAIDIMTTYEGPVSADSAARLGRYASLDNAYLAPGPVDDPALQQIPLLSGQGPAGSYLVWTREVVVRSLFSQFAPLRLPIIASMVLIVTGLLLRVRRLVADVERQRQEAQWQSRIDPLTGLANRLAVEAAQKALHQSGTPFATVVFDLDRFKSVNDVHGHATGDAVLKAVAERLERLTNSDDLLARIGGDEFVLLSTFCTEPAELAQLARRCMASIDRPIAVGDKQVRIGISLGIVPADASDLSPDQRVALADAALYRAKTHRGSSYTFAGETADISKAFLYSASA